MPSDALYLSAGDGEVVSLPGTPNLILVDPPNGQDGLSAGIETLHPGAAVPVHVHDHADELITILRGRGTAVIDGRRQPVAQGDVIYIPKGVPHGFEADQPRFGGPASSMQTLWVFPRSGLAGVLRDMANGGFDSDEVSHIYREITDDHPE